MNELKIFENPAFGQLRTMTDEHGQPWIVGKDVATVLGYSNTRDALSRHVDAEDRNTVVIPDGKGNPNQTIINESGLYSLILSSKLPTAKSFKRWVTSEVLPSIRKTGSYTEPKTQNRNQELKEKRLRIMEMNAKSRLANQMTKLWSSAGVQPAHQALALNSYFDGLSLPREAFKETAPELLDKTTIAKHLGVLSKSGAPHAHAIGAILQKLTLLPEEQTMTPYSRNGHDGVDVQYTPSVERKVAEWLESNGYPVRIEAGDKAYSVKYERRG